jgi:hypothetical protein
MPIPNLTNIYYGEHIVNSAIYSNKFFYERKTEGSGTIYTVDFEGTGETKTGYASGTVKLNAIDWNLTEVLIGTTTSDYREGNRSARLRGYGTSIMSMIQNKSGGIGSISFNYRRFGTDAQVEWTVEYSIDGGASWISAGTFTASENVQTFNSSTINNSSDNVRMRIRQTAGTGASDRRVNVDNITITGFA